MRIPKAISAENIYFYNICPICETWHHLMECPVTFTCCKITFIWNGFDLPIIDDYRQGGAISPTSIDIPPNRLMQHAKVITV
jgi:hypothetical protein